jgi:arsenite/tail-anchored protein-transporting ATPase
LTGWTKFKMNNTLPSFLSIESLRLLAFGGKGGVGKTTCATASALYLSKSFPQKKYMLVSADPAHSILDCLADHKIPDNLTVSELDATESLALFIEQHGDKLHEIASRGTFLDHEDISQFLGLSLPGLDEIMAFLDILEWVKNERYDAVIMDTAPTGHTLRLLETPGLILKWMGALDVLLGKHRYMKKVFKGTYQPDKVDRFLMDMTKSLRDMKVFMMDPQKYCFIPVMTAESMSVRETVRLLNTLTGLDAPMRDVLVNRLFPENSCPVCQSVLSRQIRELRKAQKHLSKFTLWGIPMFAREVRGGLLSETFWDRISLIRYPLPELPDCMSPAPVPVKWSGIRPQTEKTLLMFGGKGGVGKTTMACATAVYLSRNKPGKEIFLFSTDPAHSLSDCLEVEITSKPRQIAPGLTVTAINGEQEFASLKKEYLAELEDFLHRLSPHLDLAFDREVMEKIIDLSPPGLDEVMGLCRAMEFFHEDSFDILIMDTAPTGHFVRLLETPELIDQWLKVFFNIFLKYKNIFNVPGLAGRLVKLSKDLKRFRGLLGSSEESSLFVVSVLTEMAYEETIDLVRACNGIGLSVPALILNMATPVSSCEFCEALSLQESTVNKKYQESFPGMSRALVYRRGEPRGLDALESLGKELYES